MDGKDWAYLLNLAITGIIGLLGAVVKMRHDEKIKALETQNAGQAVDIKANKDKLSTCENEHKATKEELERAKREMADKTEQERRKLEDKTAAENKELQKQIDELKQRSTRSSDRRSTDPADCPPGEQK